MKKGRYTEDQMVKILREADPSNGGASGEEARVSEATIDAWRKRYGDLEVTDVRRLKQLEQENARLRSWWPSEIWRSR